MLADVVLAARVSVGDGPTDNLSRFESLNNPALGNAIDGTNTMFGVVNFPIVPGGTQSVQVDGAVIAPTGYTVNEATGEFLFDVAPTVSVVITYYYYLMPDATWQQFVLTALQKLNLSVNGVTSIEADIETVSDGIIPALLAYTEALWCMRIAAQTGLWYNQKLQERDEDRDGISRKFMTLAQEFNKQGDAFRNSYYSGAGTQLKPAFAIRLHSPRPETPSR